MQQTVLVTGATGFTGSHVLEALARRGSVQVVAACRDPGRLAPGLAVEVRAGDLRDPGYLRSLVQGVDVICHAAAWTSLWGHAEASRRLFLEPSLALIETARAAGVRRFVNTSTTSAAAPERSADASSIGIPRPFWPHLTNVVAIEDRLRECAGRDFQVANLRLGLFAGRRYGLGLLPILVPRLRTHLVPWVAGGRTGMPIVDGRDIGEAFALAATAEGLDGFEGFNIVGPEVPRVREVLTWLKQEYGLPVPHFGVPFGVAYGFAGLVTRSIVHLLEETGVDNARARERLGYRPRYDWREAIRLQMDEMQLRQARPMSMARPQA